MNRATQDRRRAVAIRLVLLVVAAFGSIAFSAGPQSSAVAATTTCGVAAYAYDGSVQASAPRMRSVAAPLSSGPIRASWVSYVRTGGSVLP